jgi:hypothetical protein
MRGFNPRIQRKKASSETMDCPVKPGNDGIWISASSPLFTWIFRKLWRESSKFGLFDKAAFSFGAERVRSRIMANFGR